MAVLLFVFGGLILLILGGEILVRGAVRIAERAGMSPLLIGLTLVGFGTSAPELVTSVQAGLAGSPGIAVGNIVGSNIANILLILGLAAMIHPVAVGNLALKRDCAVVVATAVAFTAVITWGALGRITGVTFLVMAAGYVTFAYRQERDTARVEAGGHTAAFEKAEAHDEVVPRPGSASSAGGGIAGAALATAAGLVLVMLGGDLLVQGAVSLARSAGVAEAVIGLTLVAVGTSAPELVTSTVAAWRGHADVALGNVLGSNIYNLLAIGGATALLAPGEAPGSIVRFDAPVMIGVSVLLLMFAATGRRIGRAEGAVLVLGYVAYVAVLWPR
jgi:cation:H+ antiporter